MAVRRRPYFKLIVLVTCAIPCVAAPSVLDDTHPIELHLIAGQPQSVQVPIAAGEFLQILAAPESTLAIRTTLFDAAGIPIAVTPGLGGTGGAAQIAAYSEAATTYRLDVTSQMFDQNPRDCKLSIAIRRQATSQDKLDAQAHRAFAAAAVIASKGGAAALQAAVAALDEPARLAHEAGDTLLETRAVFGKGQYLAMAGQFRDALPFFDQGLALGKTLGQPRAEAHLLTVIALVHANLEEYPESIDLYQQALALERSEGQSWEAALTLNNLAEAESALGRLDLALDRLREQEQLRRELRDELGLNQNRVALADVYLSLGEFEPALEALLATLPHWKPLKDVEYEASAYRKLAAAYSGLGEYERATDALRHAFTLQTTLTDRRGPADTLIAEAQLQTARGDLAAAQSVYQKALAESQAAKYKRGEELAMLGIGELANLRHRPSEAVPHFNVALNIASSIPLPYDEARILHQLGAAHAATGDAEQAQRELESALRIQREIGDRCGQAMTLSDLAALQRHQAKLPEALALLEEAKALVETTRSSLLDLNLRASYLAAQRSIYENAAAIASRIQPERAFEISEAAHARTLAEAIGKTDAELNEPPDLRLLDQARALDAAAIQRASAITKRQPSKDASFEHLLRERDEADASLARKTRPNITLLQVRSKLLEEGVTLLEYLTGPSESHLWIVSRSGFSHHRLPGEAVLAKAVSTLDAAITERNKFDPKEPIPQRTARLAAAERQASAGAKALSAMLMPAPTALLEAKTLVVIPDGPLHLTPFALLPAFGDSRRVVLAPSAAVLLRIRERGNETRGSRALVLADAVYSADDARVTQRAGNTTPSKEEAPITRAVQDFGIIELPRLPLTRNEAETITSVTAPRTSIQLLDFDASPAAFRKLDLQRFELIHLAAHTLINNRRPELSGVVLSLVDPKGRPQNGFLRISDIYRLHLNADLVTLSACESTVGKNIRGEGLISLARAFLQAGADSVLASLWKVDDRATAELMTRFYEARYKQRLSPAAALQAAQTSMKNTPRWSAPVYWAGFVLQGDWQ